MKCPSTKLVGGFNPFGSISQIGSFPQVGVKIKNTLPKLTFSHLKMDAWNTIVSFWGPAHFQGLWLSVSGRVFETTT